jgi:hypothetical protein
MTPRTTAIPLQATYGQALVFGGDFGTRCIKEEEWWKQEYKQE